MGGVGVEVAAAVGAELLDDLLRGHGAAVDLLGAAGQLTDLVDPGEVLDGAARDEHQRADDRDGDQDADGAAHQVGPEVAEVPGAGAGEAPYERDGDGDADGRGDEVLHREAERLDGVAHGLLARVRLPVGVGDEGRRRVERLVRADRVEPEREALGQDALGPLEQVEEEQADGGEGEHAAQIRGPAHFGRRVRADAAVDPLLYAQVLGGAVHGGHVVAERTVGQGQRHEQREQLEYSGEDGAHICAQNLSGKTRAMTR